MDAHICEYTKPTELYTSSVYYVNSVPTELFLKIFMFTNS